MNIIIDTRGENPGIDGLDSFTEIGSESRWCWNWARLLAQDGHKIQVKVDSWRNKNPMPNVEFTGTPSRPVDIVITTGREEGQRGMYKGSLYMYLHYTSEHVIANPDRYRDKNQIIVYAFENLMSNNFFKDNPFQDKTFLMPLPICEKMGDPKFNSSSLFYSAKVGPERSTEPIFMAIIEFSKKHNLPLIYSGDRFYENSRAHGEDGKIKKMISENVPSVNALPKIGMSHFMGIIESSKFCIPHQSMGAALPETIASGSFPLPTIGTMCTFSDIHREFFPNFNAGSSDSIVQAWDKCTDEAFYRKMVGMYQDRLRDNTFSESKKRFYEIIKERV